MKMTLAEVKRLLAAPTAEQLQELALDSRSGVQKLLAAYYRKQAKAAQEQERFARMLRYEERCYAAGARYIAGVDEAGRGPLAGPMVIAEVVFPRKFFLSG